MQVCGWCHVVTITSLVKCVVNVHVPWECTQYVHLIYVHTYHSELKCMCTFLHGASALTTIDIQVCLVAQLRMFVLPDLTNVCNFCGVVNCNSTVLLCF